MAKNKEETKMICNNCQKLAFSTQDKACISCNSNTFCKIKTICVSCSDSKKQCQVCNKNIGITPVTTKSSCGSCGGK